MHLRGREPVLQEGRAPSVVELCSFVVDARSEDGEGEEDWWTCASGGRRRGMEVLRAR